VKPTGRAESKILREIGYFQDFKEILKISKSLDFNTLVLKSIILGISGFSKENPEEIVKDKSCFFRKQLLGHDFGDFNTLVLKSTNFEDLENDRPVGRSFSGNPRNMSLRAI
jgi:hypothetical protein